MPGTHELSPMKKLYRAALRLIILLVTVGVFAYYLAHHPALLHRLARTPMHVLLVLLVLYVAWFGALALTVHATLRICRCPLRPGENILLNAYSTLVNFFVPGQGGVAVRALYLKKRHQLRMRHYILATLMYYTSYAVVSALMLLVSSRPWWQTCLGILGVVAGSGLVMYLYEKRSKATARALDPGVANLGFLLGATLVQAVGQGGGFGYELHTINPSITLSQAITYTGAANFSLFVALTPGAIGIRESFLLFSRQLHHVSTATIVSASLIDRAVFLALLGLLFLVTLVFHARKSLDLES